MLALVLIGFSAALYLLADNYLYRQVGERLDTVLNTISGIVESGPEGVEWEPESRQLNLDFSILGDQSVWLVADDQGQVVDRSKGSNTESFLADTSPSLQPRHLTSGIVKWKCATWQVGQRWIHAENQLSDHIETSQTLPQDDDHKFPAMSITAGVSLTPVRATLRRLAMTLIGLTVGIWFVALAAGRFVCRRALLPVNRMAVAASEIDADDIAHQRLPAAATKDELGDLNRAFNNLLDRLQEAFERQQRFTGDASHQLRTPLTAILGQIEVALRRERPAEEYRQALVTVHQRASHLARMVESLLFLARADSEARLPMLEQVNLTTWVPQHLLTWSDHIRRRDLIFECATSEPCSIKAQPALLGELLNILLDNACKYSEPGTPIKIQLETLDSAVFVKVEDKGCGIEVTDLATLFIPFCRSAEARRRGIEGVGLGLSIAKRLAEVFNAELTVVSRSSQGSCFILRFSLAVSNPTDDL